MKPKNWNRQLDHAKRRNILILMVVMSSVMGGCSEPQSTVSTEQTSLAFQGEPFDFMAADVDIDGRVDVTVVDHVANVGQTFFQTQRRTFSPGPNFAEVGFHPGNMIPWPASPHTYIMSAEGGNAIVALEPKSAEKSGIYSREPDPLRGGFKIKSVLKDRAPRFAKVFHWPGWGESLAITPYDKSGIVLLRNYDPSKGGTEARYIIRLSDQPRSVRNAHRISVADIDGDGVDELIYVTHITEEVWAIRYNDDPTAIKPELLYRSDDLEEMGMPNEAHPMDIDEDGDVDLLVADETNPGKIHILLNNGKANFERGETLDFPNKQFPEQDGVIELSTGRDKDGKNYMLVSGHEAIALYQIPEKWGPGLDIPVKVIKKLRDNVQAQLLQDIDGDGWLDAVSGLSKSAKSVWLGYGPLWQHFEQWESSGLVSERHDKETK